MYPHYSRRIAKDNCFKLLHTIFVCFCGSKEDLEHITDSLPRWILQLQVKLLDLEYQLKYTEDEMKYINYRKVR